MTESEDREITIDPEDLPGPAIIPVSGISKESRAYLESKRAKEEARDDDEEPQE